ncbi:MAG: hypothetical protein ACE5G2_05265 [Candidatus Krumholzibacteriia bacterium]
MLWAVLLLSLAPRGHADADSSAPDTSRTGVRGLEQERHETGDLARSLVDAVLYLPRVTLNGFLYSTRFGVSVSQDPRVIERAKDIFLFTDHDGFYPRAALSAESFPALGINLFHRGKRLGGVLGAAYSNDRFWTTSAHLAYQSRWGERVVKLALAGEIEVEDDRILHGIGASPRIDPRSFFLPEAAEESARYLQRQEKLELVLGLRTASNIEIFFDSMYRRRKPTSPPEGSDRLDAVFDVAGLPGAGSRDEQVYSEVSLRFQTRRYRGTPSPGLRVDGYAGVSHGVGEHKGRLLRSGGDLAVFFPVIKRNRLIVLRGTVDMVENLTDEVPISFADYPRHLTFRGVSSTRTILRTDEWVLVPSLGYQWPLAHSLSGQLFVDGLLVAHSLDRLSTRDAPWATGLALELHTRHHVFGRILLAGGSEGARVGLDVGSSITRNDRSRWR